MIPLSRDWNRAAIGIVLGGRKNKKYLLLMWLDSQYGICELFSLDHKIQMDLLRVEVATAVWLHTEVTLFRELYA